MDTPSAVFLIFVLAWMVDYWSVGADSIRDRLAFLMALAAVRVGFDGSSLDKVTLEYLTTWLDQVKGTGNTFLEKGTADDILNVIIVAVVLYSVFVMVPSKFSHKLGGAAKLTFKKSSSRINWKLWFCAFFLGMFVDLARGPFGAFARGIVGLDVALVSVIPGWFGA